MGTSASNFSFVCRRRSQAQRLTTRDDRNSHCTHIQNFGDETLIGIFSFLLGTELGRSSSGCRILARVTANDAVWGAALNTSAPDALPSSWGARLTLKGVTTLEGAHWRRLDSSVPRSGPSSRMSHTAFVCDHNTMIVHGGSGLRGMRTLGDTWAFNLETGVWTRAAAESPMSPEPRSFSADGNGGGVLRDADGTQWLVLFGGLRSEGFRDNETWILGPLGPAETACEWQWHEVQHDGQPQSRERPTTRFHHTQTVVGLDSLVVVGGHDYRIRPILDPGVLSLRDAHVAAMLRSGSLPVEWNVGQRSPGSPTPRAHHAAVEWRGRLVIVGGEGSGSVIHGDTWLFDPNLSTWARLPAVFPGSTSGGQTKASAAVINTDTLLLCGGKLRNVSFLWTLNLNAPNSGWTQCDLSRYDLTYVPAHNTCQISPSTAVLHGQRTLIVFGGHDGSQEDHFDDPIGGFFEVSRTWAVRFSDSSQVVSVRQIEGLYPECVPIQPGTFVSAAGAGVACLREMRQRGGSMLVASLSCNGCVNDSAEMHEEDGQRSDLQSL